MVAMASAAAWCARGLPVMEGGVARWDGRGTSGVAVRAVDRSEKQLLWRISPTTWCGWWCRLRSGQKQGGREQARKQEENVGLAFSMPRTRGNANTTPVRSFHTSRLLWRGRHVPKLDVSRTREPTETIPFLGLYLSN
jgi:hypothetical protein